MPSWFYASKNAPEGAPEGDSRRRRLLSQSGSNVRLPRAAMASLRSKAHRRNAHELNTKEVIKSAVRGRRVLQQGSGSDSGSGSGFGSGFNDDVSFLARLSFM